jgi:hypothetical protein
LKMKKFAITGGLAILAASLATPAAATVTVEPGTYVFTAADSSTQTYTVTIDSNGNTAVTGLSVGFNEVCRVSGIEPPYSLITGWGFGGDYVIGKTGKVTISATGNYFTFDITLDFGANGTATVGTITSYGVTLYPENPFSAHPTHALFCESPRQATAFSSYTAPGAVPAISAPHTAKSVESAE